MKIILLLVLAIVSLVAVLGQYVYAEQYKFNYTKELREEARILAICIETEIVLDYCNELYGGIDTSYGEPER